MNRKASVTNLMVGQEHAKGILRPIRGQYTLAIMHRLSISVSVAFLMLAFGVVRNAAAESIERADKNDVEMLLSAASGMNSAYWASLIGETRGRVYIEYETAVHVGSLFSKEPKRVVYWLPRAELTEEQLTQLKAYKDKYERQSVRKGA